MSKQVVLTKVKYFGGHPEFDDPKDGMVVVVDDTGIRLKSVREKFCIPWDQITAVEVEGPDQAARRVTVTRVFTLGIFALAAKKNTTEAYLHVETPEFSVGFMVPKTGAGDLRAKLGPWMRRSKFA